MPKHNELCVCMYPATSRTQTQERHRQPQDRKAVDNPKTEKTTLYNRGLVLFLQSLFFQRFLYFLDWIVICLFAEDQYGSIRCFLSSFHVPFGFNLELCCKWKHKQRINTICKRAKSANRHPQEDLSKFGYRSQSKVAKRNFGNSSYIFVTWWNT